MYVVGGSARFAADDQLKPGLQKIKSSRYPKNDSQNSYKVQICARLFAQQHQPQHAEHLRYNKNLQLMGKHCDPAITDAEFDPPSLAGKC
jgi:hypothetical protein